MRGGGKCGIIPVVKKVLISAALAVLAAVAGAETVRKPGAARRPEPARRTESGRRTTAARQPGRAAPEGPAAPRANDGRAADADAKVTAATFGPKRTKPVFTGEFQVNLVVIAFPDCDRPTDVEEIRESLSRAHGATLKEYFETYSQGVTWPSLAVYPAVYTAPHPYGHYCRYDTFANLIGFKGGAEGTARAQQLRADALAFAQKNAKGLKKGDVTCYVYCNQLNDAVREEVLRPLYPPKPDDPGALDKLTLYRPPLPWADPLWPNSIVQVTYPADGATLIHELGHVLGAPDFYHASEEHDGVAGAPALPWAYGPTGPAYCRYIYQAFVPAQTYPTYAADGEYTLDARSATIDRTDPAAPLPVLGCFIPSSHPHYVFQLEYACDERPPVGVAGAQGLIVNVINVTMANPTMGPPDLCYTYRRGDEFLKGESADADVFLRAGDTFTMTSDPAARIPPLIPGGIEITDIRETDGRCTFRLTFTKEKRTAKELKDALLPRIRLTEVEEALPTSVRARCEMMYRGEPLVEEYGFVWDVAKNPTVRKNRLPLYHRDRWDARILGLKPGTKYYVRAYARNANGLTYSKREIEVTTPKAVDAVPPLLTDRILDNFYVKRWYFTTDADGYFNSANPVLTLMSLGVYYGVTPGVAAKPGAKAAGFDVRQVHTDPGDSRPKFRLAAFEEYFGAMKKFAEASGLRAHTFGGRTADWAKTCARALKIPPKEEKGAFVEVKTAAALQAQAGAIKRWLDQSRPVLLVRENDFMPGVTDRIYPLDIAIIDGYDADGTWHVTFPEGGDRGSKSVTSGPCRAETLMVSVKNAVLLFYHP